MTRSTAARPHPSRHREAEARGERLGRPLRWAAGLSALPDEGLLDRIGDALWQRDEVGAALAIAMRLPVGDPGRVTRAQLAATLDSGDAVDAPEALADFIRVTARPPAWVDWERVEAGGRAFSRLGTTSGDVLTQLSLIGGYRFGGPTDLLVATGGLTGDSTMRRLAETQTWVLSLMLPGALRPGGPGWRLTLHVRVMHAMVNLSFAQDPHRWDARRWGLPINQADQAGTLGLFDATVILGSRLLGIPMPRGDRDDLMHLWKYVGWLMGVDEEFLTDVEQERHRFNQHFLLAAAGQTPAGRHLARDIVAVQAQRDWGMRWGWADRLRGGYERERLLSMLTACLGRRSMHDLGLPVRPPWASAHRIVANTWRHRVAHRGASGRAALERIGRAEQERGVATYVRAAGGMAAGTMEGATVGRTPSTIVSRDRVKSR